jgi:hypothetical protein
MKNETYKQYLKERRDTMPHYKKRALDAWRHIKSERALQAWKESINAPQGFSIDYNGVAHEYVDKEGYAYLFKIEPDYDAPYDDMKHQGYDYDVRDRGYNKPEFAYHGNATRHSGDGFYMWLDLSNDRSYIPAVFDVPENYVRQFYNNKNYSKHGAYINMVASARMAIEQDVNTYCKTEYCYTSVTLYAPDGEEVAQDGLGGCDIDYATSGAAFRDHGLFEAMQEEASKHIAMVMPFIVPENYAQGAYI